MNKTGDRIRARRIALGLSQEELGQRVGVQKAAINKYETGVVVNLKRSMIEKLAIALDVSPTYLLGMEEEDTTVSALQQLRDEDRALLAVARNMTPEEVAAMTEFIKRTKGIK